MIDVLRQCEDVRSRARLGMSHCAPHRSDPGARQNERGSGRVCHGTGERRTVSYQVGFSCVVPCGSVQACLHHMRAHPGIRTITGREVPRRWCVVVIHRLFPDNGPLLVGRDAAMQRRRGSQGAARDLDDAPGADSMGVSGVGRAVVDCAGLRGTLP